MQLQFSISSWFCVVIWQKWGGPQNVKQKRWVIKRHVSVYHKEDDQTSWNMWHQVWPNILPCPQLTKLQTSYFWRIVIVDEADMEPVTELALARVAAAASVHGSIGLLSVKLQTLCWVQNSTKTKKESIVSFFKKGLTPLLWHLTRGHTAVCTLCLVRNQKNCCFFEPFRDGQLSILKGQHLKWEAQQSLL